MPTYVKVVVRATYWSSLDPFNTIVFDDGVSTSAELLEGAYFLSGDRAPIGFPGSSYIAGTDSGPLEDQFTFLAPDMMFTLPTTAVLGFSYGYEPYEIDILLSSDNVTYVLAGTGTHPGDFSAAPLEISLSAMLPPAAFIPWWTDHTNTQER